MEMYQAYIRTCTRETGGARARLKEHVRLVGFIWRKQQQCYELQVKR